MRPHGTSTVERGSNRSSKICAGTPISYSTTKAQVGFCEKTERDLAAVTAGLTLPWNSGVPRGRQPRHRKGERLCI
ncbi:hypothetical protein [Streptomyces antarcticus]|uniref:hypothetical protein n=1 Tax=Streptomyces antarcticus TaxID=2996458 RepID=UPI00226EE097|nr:MULTISPECIES: hypothetical protein [unclassified Streptomyces]MCY0943368.1 hypothetical protein [Streptomyces sp. H34-AA3]MCZ4085338.1 hypothetical protein [Streptomyces sp. H34-S5]